MKGKTGSRKGQFFILGAIVISSLVLGFAIAGEPFAIYSSGSDSPSTDPERNIEELIKAGNIALSENKSHKSVIKNLRTEIEFQDYLSSSKGDQFRSYFLLGTPHEDGFKVSLVNLYDSYILANLSIGNSKRELNKIKQRQEKTVIFDSVPQNFDLTLNISSPESDFSHSYSSFKKNFVLCHLEIGGESEKWVRTSMS